MKRGFTLVELMIVIAIVGLLSSVIIVALNNARIKGNDAKIKSMISAARNQAELFYNNNNYSYNGTHGDEANNCDRVNTMFTDPGNLSRIRQYTDSNNYPSDPGLRCSSTNNAYEITVPMQQDLGNTSSVPHDWFDYWCINNQGFSGIIEARSHARAHPTNDLDCVPDNP